MATWIDLSDDLFSSVREMWGDIGIVVYSVGYEKGPSNSYMMVL